MLYNNVKKYEHKNKERGKICIDINFPLVVCDIDELLNLKFKLNQHTPSPYSQKVKIAEFVGIPTVPEYAGGKIKI